MSTRFVQHNAILYHFIVTSGLVFVAVIARKKRLLDIRMHNLIFQFGPFSMHNPSFAFITNPNFPFASNLVRLMCAASYIQRARRLQFWWGYWKFGFVLSCSFRFLNKSQVVIHEHGRKKRQFYCHVEIKPHKQSQLLLLFLCVLMNNIANVWSSLRKKIREKTCSQQKKPNAPQIKFTWIKIKVTFTDNIYIIRCRQ